MQWQTEVEDKESSSYEKEFEGEHRWNARDRTVIARMEQHPNKSDSIKVEIEELESLLGPEDLEVDLRQILMYARRKKGGRTFEIFSSKCQSEHLAASRVRWDERQRLMAFRRKRQEAMCKKLDSSLPNDCKNIC